MTKRLHSSVTQMLLVLLCSLTSAFSTAQDVQLNWAKSFGGTNSDYGYSVAVDAAGNVYTTGYYQGTVDFDPGEGIFNLTSSHGTQDVFISKLDASGNFLWAKGIDGPSIDYGHAIAVDASGNVYTTGRFYYEADFDPGTGTNNLASAGGYDIFISKLDTDGNYLWAKRIGGTGNDEGYAITVDASGNVYTTGSFSGTVDFDPGEGTAELGSAGGDDIFICKLNASGNYLWAKRMGGTQSFEIGKSITIDASGNIYTTGSFSGTADFDPGDGTYNLSSIGPPNIFISKLNSSGNFLWAKSMGVTIPASGNSIALDASGNVYTTGYFGGTVDFDPGEGTAELTSAGYSDIFISKLDPSGNYLWAKSIGGAGNDAGTSIKLDSYGNIYSTGYFSRDDSYYGNSVDFDPGAGEAYLKPDGGADIYISKLDTDGNFVWAKRHGATGYDGGNSITIDDSDNVYITGQFAGQADFDPGIGTFGLTSKGDADVFILKLNPLEEPAVVVNAQFTSHLGWCTNCNQVLYKIADANSRNQYQAYIYGDALTNSATKFTVWWDGSAWKGQLAEKSVYTSGYWASNPTYASNALNTLPKPPCSGWSNGFSLSGDCASPSVTVQAPAGAPSMNASAAKTTGVVNGKNAFEIPVTSSSDKVTVQWNSELSRWEMVLVSPSARILAETVLAYNVGDVGTNPPCGGWSDGYELSGDICISAPLPVTLLSFTAETTPSNVVKLNWTTTLEQNAWYFGIERSRDARSFQEIAQVETKGTSASYVQYLHTDETPLRARSYYRLRQVDRDGSFHYSKIVTVRTTGTDAPYPNPIKNSVIQIEAAEGAELKLNDLTGRIIHFTTKRINEELVELQPSQKLGTGVYVISVNGTGHRVLVD